MHKIIFIVCCIVCVSCKLKQPSSVQINQTKQFANDSLEVNNTYDEIISEISKTKIFLRKNWQSLSVTKKSEQFVNVIIKQIIPFWYGTHWSFNGTTRIPKQGTIACGYFVTTVLQDAGLNISRNKLAQCASEQMIRELISKKYIHQFRNADINTFISEIKSEGTGIFIIGLDNHTGFIYNDGKEIFFIHSYYFNSVGVIKEKASESSALYYSKYRITGKISDDETVLNNWIYKE